MGFFLPKLVEIQSKFNNTCRYTIRQQILKVVCRRRADEGTVYNCMLCTVRLMKAGPCSEFLHRQLWPVEWVGRLMTYRTYDPTVYECMTTCRTAAPLILHRKKRAELVCKHKAQNSATAPKPVFIFTLTYYSDNPLIDA